MASSPKTPRLEHAVEKRPEPPKSSYSEVMKAKKSKRAKKKAVKK